MQKARRRPQKGSDRLQTYGFRFYFTPLFEVLFTFPSRYWFTIGLSVVFSLAGWCRLVHTGFLRSRATQDTEMLKFYVIYGTITLYGLSSQSSSIIKSFTCISVLQPQICLNNFGLGSSAFARHYLRNHYYFLFLHLLRCFSSVGQPPYWITIAGWVSPFGNLRINGYLHLPTAYRSLSRPSSPLRAKASPVRPQ